MLENRLMRTANIFVFAPLVLDKLLVHTRRKYLYIYTHALTTIIILVTSTTAVLVYV